MLQHRTRMLGFPRAPAHSVAPKRQIYAGFLTPSAVPQRPAAAVIATATRRGQHIRDETAQLGPVLSPSLPPSLSLSHSLFLSLTRCVRSTSIRTCLRTVNKKHNASQCSVFTHLAPILADKSPMPNQILHVCVSL